MNHEPSKQGRPSWSALAFAFALPWTACPKVSQAQTATNPPASVQPNSPHVDQADQRIRFYQAQVARDPDYWTSYNRLAAAYAQKARETGDISYFELAEKSLQQSLKLESVTENAAPAYTQLATVDLALHRFRDAGENAVKAIELDPRDLSAVPYAGDAQLEQGNYDQSQHFYDQLADPKDGKPHVGLAFLATSHGAGLAWIKGDIDRATTDLDQAITLAQDLHLPAENLAWTQFMRGEQFFLLGDLTKAESDETASLASFPRYHRALAAMAQVRAAQSRYPEAIALYKQAIAIIPLPLYIAALGDLYTATGDSVNAEKQYQFVEFIGKLSVINQQVFNRELATFYADHDRNLAQALALAQKELEVRHDVYTSDALAWALLKNRQPQQAHEAITQALRMGTRDAIMEYHAGMIEAALGHRAEATTHLQQALAINPHFHVLFAPQATRTLVQLKVPGSGSTVAASEANHAP